ncbi:hypothetical protein GWI33_005839 [Rhynchophorus ferrugineus]|uniref:Uncharacterized protein n=1 Tax=Rhynchophorus ferrugineus TaxID=354439 RepID=A0A834MHP9_RHYFE|nr:hypothetical protein GWI33_005839 [Rhynchophorus ferrugineus]
MSRPFLRRSRPPPSPFSPFVHEGSDGVLDDVVASSIGRVHRDGKRNRITNMMGEGVEEDGRGSVIRFPSGFKECRTVRGVERSVESDNMKLRLEIRSIQNFSVLFFKYKVGKKVNSGFSKVVHFKLHVIMLVVEAIDIVLFEY